MLQVLYQLLAYMGTSSFEEFIISRLDSYDYNTIDAFPFVFTILSPLTATYQSVATLPQVRISDYEYHLRLLLKECPYFKVLLQKINAFALSRKVPACYYVWKEGALDSIKKCIPFAQISAVSYELTFE